MKVSKKGRRKWGKNGVEWREEVEKGIQGRGERKGEREEKKENEEEIRQEWQVQKKEDEAYCKNEKEEKEGEKEDKKRKQIKKGKRDRTYITGERERGGRGHIKINKKGK